MIRLLADIGFGRGGRSAEHVVSGWGEVEPGHRWSIGPESSVALPWRSGLDHIVVLDAAPWCDPGALPSQTVMLAINGRLLTTLQMRDRRVLAVPAPAALSSGDTAVLSFTHLSSRAPRPAGGLYRDGQALALGVSSIRVFCRDGPAVPVSTLGALPAIVADGSMQDLAARCTGLAPVELVTRFESLGHDCEFGTVQRSFGAEPLGLLRFAGVVTHKLVDGLMARFADIGAPETTRIFVSGPPEPEFKVHEQLYYLWYSVGKTPQETTHAAVLREQCRRLAFLRRKFDEDLQNATKIFVLTRGEPITEAEALAVFCALRHSGPSTLLWTTHGEVSRTGQVDCLMPGFLRGHLGQVDHRNYATQDAWLSVLTNAYVQRHELV